MKTKLVLYPYKMGSESAKLLASSLNDAGVTTKRVRPDGNYKPYGSHVIVNWGSSTNPNWMGQLSLEQQQGILNNPSCVAMASNKLTTFISLEDEGISVPIWTTEKNEAVDLINEGSVVVCRTKLNAHSGDGIVIAKTVEELVDAPLYTKYTKKRNEYRVHVFMEDVIAVQEKKRDTEIVDRSDLQAMVRSHVNGWVFCREGVVTSQRLKSLAVEAVNALGLDFGAVDIIYNQHLDTYYVLEVNTAVGLSGQTLTDYTNAFTNYFNSL